MEFPSEADPSETVTVTLEGKQKVLEDPEGTPIIIDHNGEGCCGDGDRPGMQTEQAQLVVADPGTTVSETGTGLVQTNATLA